jgi:hypothetical protein
MDHPIEARLESNGRWVATMARIPGLVVYEKTREDALVSARRLSAILRNEDRWCNERILAFYPGQIPNSSQPEFPN